MSSKLGTYLTKNYSINFDLPKRSKKRIIFIILHYTGMNKESDAIQKLCDPKSKVSCHYFIKKNGEVLNLVPDLYTSWHAGKSFWKKFNSLNNYSIGIEIVIQDTIINTEVIHQNKFFSLIKLLKNLKKKYNIKKHNILGHSNCTLS